MAKRKTPKLEKVVDLAAKAEKVTDAELTVAKEYLKAVNLAQRDLGIIESRKHALCHEIMNIGARVDDHYRELTEKYNCSDIDLNTGEIKYNKKDDNNKPNKENNDR